MVQERCILPIKCRDCGAVFDLWYDLQAQEQLRTSSRGRAFVPFEKRFAALLKQQSLCWNCRKNARAENFGGMEYEMEIEFE